MVRRRRLVPVRRGHRKFVGIERKTQRRYNKAVEKFFIFCTFFHGPQPNSGEELNFLLCEFVNHFWQDDEPYQNAVDAVAAVRRHLPTYRSHTSTAQAYLRNWASSVTRRSTRTGRRPRRATSGTSACCAPGRSSRSRYSMWSITRSLANRSCASRTARRGKTCRSLCWSHDPVARQLLRIMIRQELGRLRLRAHVGLSCTWSSRVGGGGGHP